MIKGWYGRATCDHRYDPYGSMLGGHWRCRRCGKHVEHQPKDGYGLLGKLQRLFG